MIEQYLDGIRESVDRKSNRLQVCVVEAEALAGPMEGVAGIERI
jgi:hypothetical protein